MTNAEQRRLARAKELAKELKNGTYQPASFDKQESFFPQRPIIKKDKKDIARIYEVKPKEV